MKDAPFEERLVAAEGEDAEATAARKRLQAALDTLNPAAGKTTPPGAGKGGKAKAKKAARKAQAGT
jgi:hypothetical protein